MLKNCNSDFDNMPQYPGIFYFETLGQLNCWTEGWEWRHWRKLKLVKQKWQHSYLVWVVQEMYNFPNDYITGFIIQNSLQSHKK